MVIKAVDVKKLRDATGAGMMDAKKALTEADGDFEKATELLRVSGAAKVSKRADREAANGLVAASGKALIQLAAETDFVAKNAEFMGLAEEVVAACATAQAADVTEAAAVELASGRTVADAIADMSAKIGEKLELAAAAYFTGDTHTYLHRRSQDLPPQVGVMIEYSGGTEAFIHSIALQIAAMQPKYLTRDEVPADIVAAEKRVALEKAEAEGKPERAIPRIVEGRLVAYYKEAVLLDQPAVSDDKMSVAQLLEANGVEITRFVRFSAGG